MNTSARPALPIKSSTYANFGVVADYPTCLRRRAVNTHAYFPWAHLLSGDY